MTQQPLFYQRKYLASSKKYSGGDWQVVHYRPDDDETLHTRRTTRSTTAASTRMTQSIVIPLPLGGVVTVHPNLISKSDRDVITDEILQYQYPPTQPPLPDRSRAPAPALAGGDGVVNDGALSLLRQYKVRNSNEPRLNCLLHTAATTDDISSDSSTQQPGYRYGRVTMKGRSYDEHLLHTLQFTKDMEQLYTDTMGNEATVDAGANDTDTDISAIFNIGAHIVLYCNGQDHMGFHADDDQNESYILATILSQPPQHHNKRYITFKPKPRPKPKPAKSPSQKKQKTDREEEEFEIHYRLLLNEGDAYSMDGIMQEMYVHGVPKEPKSNAPKISENEDTTGTNNPHHNHRLVIVFRRGEYREYTEDSGKPVTLHDIVQQQRQEIRDFNSRYTFGHLPGLSFGNTYCREQLLLMGAHMLCQKSVSGNSQVGSNAIIISGLKHMRYSNDIYDDILFCATVLEGAKAMTTSFNNLTPIRVFRSSSYKSHIRARKDDGNNHTGANIYRYDGLYKIAAVAPALRSCVTKVPVYQFTLQKIWESW